MLPCSQLLRTCSRKRIIFLSLIVGFLFLYMYFDDSHTGYPFRSIPVLESDLSKSSEEEYYKKWIVITTVNYPTDQVKKLAGMSGWRLLVVADQKTPTDWIYPNVTFLDITTQLKLGYKVVDHLPWNSYTRKVIGYLYAIQHGAQYIYDTDDDNAPDNVQSFETNFVLEAKTSGLVPSTEDSSVVNPYAHFGQETVWPRGYPLDSVMMEHDHTYRVCEMKTPIIQQGIVNGDPDVDAIFRLTRKSIESSLNIQFDNHAPPIVLPQAVFSPFNSQNTLFHYEAFWALLLPVTVAFRVTDIWRGYWAQPLLWRMGGYLGFYPPHTTQIRNAHTYLKDFDNENELYIQSGKLVDLLTTWYCEETSFYSCLMDLSSLMASAEMWSMNELSYIQAWIEDLQAVGYKEPQLLNFSPNKICSDIDSNLVRFYGVEQVKTDQQPDKRRVTLMKFCNFDFSYMNTNVTPGENETKTLPSPPLAEITNSDQESHKLLPNEFNSTLLVVTFNRFHFENIWLLDSIYRPYFPNILYCGSLKNASYLDDLLESDEFKDAHTSKFSFIDIEVYVGILCYECSLKAIQMKYSVESYLVLSDDILLNFRNNWKFPSEEIWLLGETKFLNTEVPTSDWVWWGSPNGINATKCALDRLTKESPTNELFSEFLSNRKKFGYNSTTVPYAPGDFIYFPASKQKIYYEVGKVVRECEVFLEIAVPFLGNGISAPDKLVKLPGFNLWGKDRARALSFFNSSISLIHPVKINDIMTDEKRKNEYCDKYIRHVIGS